MRLHERAMLQAEIIGEYQNGIGELERYLASPKFREDTTVQVSDIFLRLNEIKNAVSKLGDVK